MGDQRATDPLMQKAAYLLQMSSCIRFEHNFHISGIIHLSGKKKKRDEMKDEMNTGSLFTTSKVVIILNKPQHNFNYFYFNKS